MGKWQKGQSGNPKGKKPADPETKRIKHLTKESFAKFVNEWLYLTPEQMQVRIDNPQTCALDRMIGIKILKIMDSHDWPQLEFVLNRMIGKITEHVNVTGGLLDFLKSLPDDEQD